MPSSARCRPSIQRCVDSSASSTGALPAQREDGTDLRVEAIDAGEVGIDRFGRRRLLAGVDVDQLGHAEVSELHARRPSSGDPYRSIQRRLVAGSRYGGRNASSTDRSLSNSWLSFSRVAAAAATRSLGKADASFLEHGLEQGTMRENVTAPPQRT